MKSLGNSVPPAKFPQFLRTALDVDSELVVLEVLHNDTHALKLGGELEPPDDSDGLRDVALRDALLDVALLAVLAEDVVGAGGPDRGEHELVVFVVVVGVLEDVAGGLEHFELERVADQLVLHPGDRVAAAHRFQQDLRRLQADVLVDRLVRHLVQV